VDASVAELMHWVPTPLLALGFWALMKKAFQDHEEKQRLLIEKFEKAMEKQSQHDLALALMKQIQDAQTRELLQLRDQKHALTNHFMELQTKVLVRILDEGSGPKHDPRRPE
jgi:hypothetical protein